MSPLHLEAQGAESCSAAVLGTCTPEIGSLSRIPLNSKLAAVTKKDPPPKKKKTGVCLLVQLRSGWGFWTVLAGLREGSWFGCGILGLFGTTDLALEGKGYWKVSI